MVERAAVNRDVAGSSPASGANLPVEAYILANHAWNRSGKSFRLRRNPCAISHCLNWA